MKNIKHQVFGTTRRARCTSSSSRRTAGIAVVFFLTGLAGLASAHDLALDAGADSRAEAGIFRTLDYVADATGDVLTITIHGVAVQDLERLSWNGADLEVLVPSAEFGGLLEVFGEDGSVVVVVKTSAGFPSLGDGVLTLHLASGLAVSVPVVIGPSSANVAHDEKSLSGCTMPRFSKPATVALNSNCNFGSKTCGAPGLFHTGRDYAGSGDVLAAADGVIVRIENLASSDHGMGRNVILRHGGSTCASLFTSYSHMASFDQRVKVGAEVKRGQVLGVIGGSGYGSNSYWPKHVHVEVKSKALTGNPFGVRDGKCTTPNVCWGYTPRSPEEYGYIDPRSVGM